MGLTDRAVSFRFWPQVNPFSATRSTSNPSKGARFDPALCENLIKIQANFNWTVTIWSSASFLGPISKIVFESRPIRLFGKKFLNNGVFWLSRLRLSRHSVYYYAGCWTPLLNSTMLLLSTYLRSSSSPMRDLLRTNLHSVN